MIRRLLFGGGTSLLILLALGGLGWWWFDDRMSSPGSSTGAVEIPVTAGTTWAGAVEALRAHGLVRDPWLFDMRARLRHRRVPLRAGLFVFQRSWSPDQLMDKLAAGPDGDDPDAPLVFRVIPGENLFQVRETLQNLGIAGDLFAIDRRRERVDALEVGAPWPLAEGARTRLEGYLFPDSYHLSRHNPSLDRAVELATRQFRKVFKDLERKHAASYAAVRREFGLDRHGIVTMASLVEKETQAPGEGPRVAAVFYNRLRKRMALGTDPTLVYGPDTWREVPAPRHRKDPTNPYNTYLNQGLPPGPICNPGAAALAAALAPATTDELYFVARRDGTGRHAFARTFEEHRANITRYLRAPTKGPAAAEPPTP